MGVLTIKFLYKIARPLVLRRVTINESNIVGLPDVTPFQNLASNSSKVALIHLIERLIKGGFDFLDTQFINEHLKQFGAVELSNDEFKKILSKSVTNKADFFSFSPKGYLPNNLYPNSNSFLL